LYPSNFILPMPPPPPPSPLFPYTTLFRSHGDRPGARLKVAGRVFRVHATLDGVAAQPVPVHHERQRLPRRDANLLLHQVEVGAQDRKSTRLNSSHDQISYAVFCLKKKTQK